MSQRPLGPAVCRFGLSDVSADHRAWRGERDRLMAQARDQLVDQGQDGRHLATMEGGARRSGEIRGTGWPGRRTTERT